MRSPTLPLLALLAACGGSDEPPVEDTDVFPGRDRVDLCSETYAIPGPLGTVLTDAVDAHADVFDPTVENIGTTPDEGQVGPDPLHVHIGWPGSDTSRSVSFVWSTNTGTLASLVEIAEGEDLSGEVKRYEGVSYRYGGVDAQQYRVHELKLCNRLKPNTTYSYRVGGEDHWSTVYTFRTPPEPGTFDTFTAIIAGDSRGSYEEWAALVARARAEGADFVLFSGDMVVIGGDQREWYGWFEATDDWFAETFFVPAHGNHELLMQNYFAMFSLPGNEQWFNIDYGNLTLVSLNDTVSDEAHKEVEQVRFMEEVFGESTADWKFAMHHSATYSTCTEHGSAETLRAMWESTFEAQGVDIVLAGHNHIYERSHPIRNGQVVPIGEGITYLVTGGAGAPLYTGTSEEWFGLVANPVLHYVVAEFDSTGVQMTAKDLAGNVIDEFFVPIGKSAE